MGLAQEGRNMTLLPPVGTIFEPWRHQILPEHAKVWSKLLDDPNPIHLDAEVVVRLGIGSRPVNQGPANITYLYNMLAVRVPHGRVASLDARMTGTIWVGDTIEVTGRVVAHEREAGVSRVRCALVLRAVPDGVDAVVATADLHFDSQA